MRKLILKLLSLFSKRREKNPVIQDLLDNDHHYCKTCGDLYYSANPKRLYCSKACKVHFNNSKRSKK
jgi:predicted transcriptional regulator